jgi:hypothetical protein
VRLVVAMSGSSKREPSSRGEMCGVRSGIPGVTNWNVYYRQPGIFDLQAPGGCLQGSLATKLCAK